MLLPIRVSARGGADSTAAALDRPVLAGRAAWQLRQAEPQALQEEGSPVGHREGAPVVGHRVSERPERLGAHGRHGRPKPLGGQLRLPAFKVSGAAMAMSTVVGISIATTLLINEQQRVGADARMASARVTPLTPDLTASPSAMLSASASGGAAKRSPAPNGRTPGAFIGPGRPAGSGTPTGPAAAPTGRLALAEPTAGPLGPVTSTPSASPSPSASVSASPDPSASAPASAGTTPKPGATRAPSPSFSPGLVLAAPLPDTSVADSAAASAPVITPAPTAAAPAPAPPSAPVPVPLPASEALSNPVATIAPAHGRGNAAVGLQRVLKLTVTAPLAAFEVDIRLDATDTAAASALAWSTLPGTQVSLEQDDDGSVLYRFTPAPGEDVQPGDYSFVVQDAAPAAAPEATDADSWTASGFALDDPRAVAARGTFASSAQLG